MSERHLLHAGGHGGHEGHGHIGLQNKPAHELTEKEKKWLEEQAAWQLEHAGHDLMHAEMLLVLVGALFVSQILLIVWKQKHPRSYNVVSLLGLWLIPLGVSIYHFYWRFIIIWAIFSCITLRVMQLARRRPLGGKTPRLVYRWFVFLYNGSYAFGILAYVIMMFVLCGFYTLFSDEPEPIIDMCIVLFFYGVFFGVLGRDLSELCAEEMASTIGYYDKDSISTRALEENICAVCGQSTNSAKSEKAEAVYKLSCVHTFHDACIRGWCIIGKKQICPYCKEKVDLQRLFSAPWEKPHMLYGRLLDWVRYLIVWHPAIILIAQFINDKLGLK